MPKSKSTSGKNVSLEAGKAVNKPKKKETKEKVKKGLMHHAEQVSRDRGTKFNEGIYHDRKTKRVIKVKDRPRTVEDAARIQDRNIQSYIIARRAKMAEKDPKMLEKGMMDEIKKGKSK